MHNGLNHQAELGLEWCREISNRDAKERIADSVAALARSGETVGAGSGSTSFLTVVALGRRAALGLDIAVVPTSIEIELACHAAGLNVLSMPDTRVDWCFDGADEVDPTGRLLKGRGGALARERDVFSVAQRRLVVADESKSVGRLGEKFPVPVEVDPRWIRSAYEELSGWPNVTHVALRMAVAKDGPVVTEAGRVILDVRMREIREDEDLRLLAVAGIVASGIFVGFDFERVSDA